MKFAALMMATLVVFTSQVSAANGLTDAELALEAPDTPISASEVTEVVLEGMLEFGYKDEQGRYVVDLLERDRAYLGIKITTPDGRPVVGAMPNISMDGSSQLLLTDLVTAENGVMNFGVVGGQMGMDRVTANIGDSEIEFAINVISLRARGFPTVIEEEGIISWGDLMSAQLEYTEKGMVASFPSEIQQQAGKTVKISGFMMPLQPELEQSHFLLTSNPPSCFFHIPGGPAGSVEVVAAEGVEVSWSPIVIEGTFEPLETSEVGVVYRLVDAKLVP